MSWMWMRAEGNSREAAWKESIWCWGAMTPVPVSHIQGDTPQHLQIHPFKGDQQFLLWASFRASVNVETFLLILLNTLQKQKLSQDPLGMLVGYLNTATGLYGCGCGVLAWINFILLVTCKVVSHWLLTWSHTLRIKIQNKRCSIQDTVSRGNNFGPVKTLLFFQRNEEEKRQHFSPWYLSVLLLQQ